MKASKIFLIIETVLLYISELCFVIVIPLTYIDESGNIIRALLLTKFILDIVTLNIAFVTIILSFITIIKRDYNPTKYTMVIKLILIPFYALNFVEWNLYVAGMLNPFLMLAIPVVIFLGMCYTYLIMISTSLCDLIYAIKHFKDDNRKLVITSFVFLFMFCFDVIGSIMLYISTKNNKTIGDINEL